MMNTMTMEQLERALRGEGKAMGRINNKRQQQQMNTLEKEVRKEVVQEMDIFKEIARYTNALTKEDVAINTIPNVDSIVDIVGVDGQDFEVGFDRDVELPSWCVSHANTGIRYTDDLEPLMTW